MAMKTILKQIKRKVRKLLADRINGNWYKMSHYLILNNDNKTPIGESTSATTGM